jgi:hypothetical protein
MKSAPHRRQSRPAHVPLRAEFEAGLMRSQVDSEKLMEAVVGRRCWLGNKTQERGLHGLADAHGSTKYGVCDYMQPGMSC